MGRKTELLHALLAMAVAACARPAPRPEHAGPPPSWPAPPSQPLVRWEGTFPSPGAPREPPSFWSRAWNRIVGLGDGPAEPPPQLARPFGVAVQGDRLLVADPDARRVLRVDWRSGAAEPVTCPERAWAMPMAVAASADALVVADAGAHALVRVSGGRCSTLGADALERPSGVAIALGRVYAVDPPRHAVVGFSADGREEVRFGGRGEGDGKLNFPTGLASLADGTLLVVDSLNFRISRYAPDGRYQGGFGEPGDGDGAFGRPKAVAVDGQGRIFVTDAASDVVIVFSPEGAFQLAFGGTGRGTGHLMLPAGLAAGSGRLFVADSFNARVQIYELVGEAP